MQLAVLQVSTANTAAVSVKPGIMAPHENIEGFFLVDKDGKDVLDRKGDLMPVGPVLVERFPEFTHLVCTMAFTVLSNNDSEDQSLHSHMDHGDIGLMLET